MGCVKPALPAALRGLTGSGVRLETFLLPTLRFTGAGRSAARFLQSEASALRGLSFGVGRSSGLSAPESDRRTDTYAPTATGSRLKRRLADTIEFAFESALQQGDLATAEDLLAVLENMQARAKVSLRNDRRGTDRRLERVRRELELRKQSRHRRF